ILTPKQFGNNLNKTQNFFQNYDPIGFNYWDYMEAWTKVFWFQNTQHRHSRLIYFKRKTNYIFPNWFYQWWDFFGPIPKILPSPTDEGYKLFQSKFN
ncbi:hypothetical protein S245_048820, partial [Arachis hypogaea]